MQESKAPPAKRLVRMKGCLGSVNKDHNASMDLKFLVSLMRLLDKQNEISHCLAPELTGEAAKDTASLESLCKKKEAEAGIEEVNGFISRDDTRASVRISSSLFES